MTGVQAQKMAQLVIDYLKDSGNMAILPEVITLLKRKSVGLGLQDSAVITSPAPLEASELKTITAFIADKFGQEFNVVTQIDPSLIAGFTIKIGDQVIDSSLSAKLENIRKDLI